jgi:hypothetical protein
MDSIAKLVLGGEYGAIAETKGASWCCFSSGFVTVND